MYRCLASDPDKDSSYDGQQLYFIYGSVNHSDRSVVEHELVSRGAKRTSSTFCLVELVVHSSLGTFLDQVGRSFWSMGRFLEF